MLGEMTARGTARAESSMKSKQQPWNNGQARELPHPEPSLCADSSIKPPASCHSAGLSRDYTDPLSPVALSLLLTLSVRSARRLHFFSSLSLLSLHFFSLQGDKDCGHRGNKGCRWHLFIYFFWFYHHWRYSPLDFFGTRRCQNRPRVSEEELIPVFLEIPSFDVMIWNGSNSSLDKTVWLAPALFLNPLSSKEPYVAMSSGLLLYIIV